MTESFTFRDAVREYFPEATPEEADFILWEKTGFPCFWNIGVDGDTPEQCLRKQLQEFKDEIDHRRKGGSDG